MLAEQLKHQGGVLSGGSETLVVSQPENILFEIKGSEAVRISDEQNKTPTLKARMGTGGNNIPCILKPPVVRKLTPTECERLQGFPDGWTQIPYRGKSAEECPDSPRYKAIGNSMCTNVMKWIGERLSAYLTSQ